MTITLRPHQQRALDALESASKGTIYCPTGGGKTFIMIEDLKRRLILRSVRLSLWLFASFSVQLFESSMSQRCCRACVLHVHSGDVAGNRTQSATN